MTFHPVQTLVRWLVQKPSNLGIHRSLKSPVDLYYYRYTVLTHIINIYVPVFHLVHRTCLNGVKEADFLLNDCSEQLVTDSDVSFSV